MGFNPFKSGMVVEATQGLPAPSRKGIDSIEKDVTNQMVNYGDRIHSSQGFSRNTGEKVMNSISNEVIGSSIVEELRKMQSSQNRGSGLQVDAHPSRRGNGLQVGRGADSSTGSSPAELRSRMDSLLAQAKARKTGSGLNVL
jgi:hypothetical protein